MVVPQEVCYPAQLAELSGVPQGVCTSEYRVRPLASVKPEQPGLGVEQLNRSVLHPLCIQAVTPCKTKLVDREQYRNSPADPVGDAPGMMGEHPRIPRPPLWNIYHRSGVEPVPRDYARYDVGIEEV